MEVEPPRVVEPCGARPVTEVEPVDACDHSRCSHSGENPLDPGPRAGIVCRRTPSPPRGEQPGPSSPGLGRGCVLVDHRRPIAAVGGDQGASGPCRRRQSPAVRTRLLDAAAFCSALTARSWLGHAGGPGSRSWTDQPWAPRFVPQSCRGLCASRRAPRRQFAARAPVATWAFARRGPAAATASAGASILAAAYVERGSPLMWS